MKIVRTKGRRGGGGGGGSGLCREGKGGEKLKTIVRQNNGGGRKMGVDGTSTLSWSVR